MNTTRKNTAEENLKAALSYYGAMQNKGFDTMESYLSDDICLLSPLAEMHGKDAVISAAKNFGGIL
jgi:ketosteroid isomerase-like protein